MKVPLASFSAGFIPKACQFSLENAKKKSYIFKFKNVLESELNA